MESANMTTAAGIEEKYQGNARGCTGLTLKLIAVITMLIDHTAATILERQITGVGYVWVNDANYHDWYQIYYWLRVIGRMAFPIYIFLLVEGFTHTRSVAKYIRNMTIFVLLSEVPFDMAFQRNFFDMSYNSVFLTLLIGLLTITGISWIDKTIVYEKPTILKNFVKGCIILFTIFLGMGIAELLQTDYGAAGVAGIAVMYMLRKHRVIGFAATVIVLAAMAGTIEAYALFMLVPIYFYNGERGKQNTFLKYFFYAFYPVHLTILSLICYGLGLGI